MNDYFGYTGKEGVLVYFNIYFESEETIEKPKP
jgi:hypothetical protein